MAKQPFWTEPRFMGFALLLECLLAGWEFALRPQDEPGTCISRLLPRAPFRLLATHRTRWTWAAHLAISGVVLTRLVLTRLTSLFWDAGDHHFSLPRMVAFGFGTVLGLIRLAARPSFDVWAAQTTPSTGVIPACALAIHTARGGMLSVRYTVLTCSALAASGGAVLPTPGLTGVGGLDRHGLRPGRAGDERGHQGCSARISQHPMPLLMGIPRLASPRLRFPPAPDQRLHSAEAWCRMEGNHVNQRKHHSCPQGAE